MFKGLLDNPSAFPVQSRDSTLTYEDNDRIPKVVNVVTTAHFLPQELIPGTKKRRYQFALHTLSMCFPVSQFKPSAFSSVIVRLKNDSDYFTCLFFSSGRCVFVRCKSPQHSLYITQQVRLLFNNLRVPIDFGDGSPIRMDVLGKYITLQRWNLENMVMSGNLGFRVCLPKLATVFAGIISYAPKDFPGAWCVVYIKPPSQCRCTKTFKCGCKATVLVFDRGSVIVAGTRTIQEGNSVYYRFSDAMEAFVDDGVEFEKKDRYEARVARFSEYLRAYADAAASQKKQQKKERKRSKINEEEEEDDDEENYDYDEENRVVMETLINDTLEKLNLSLQPFSYREADPSVTDLMKACEGHQLANVRWLLAHDPTSDPHVCDARGKSAWDRCLEFPETDPVRLLVSDFIKTRQAASL